MNLRCAFSGHRNLNGSGFDFSLLDRVIGDLIKTGTKEFYCGMALGFDIAAAESVLAQKNPEIKLIACLPCANQTETFSESAKLRYQSVIDRCDKVITLSPEYYGGCMHARDRFMVDSCDVLVCFLRKHTGGTFYTVNYARRCGKKVIEL